MEIIDACGLACPQPVVRARRAMAGGVPFVIAVDNDVAVDNVTRMARSAGWETEVRQPERKRFEIDLWPGKQPAAAPREASGGADRNSVVVLLASDRLGEGAADLGSLLMRAFLHTLVEVAPRPDHVICMNAGVRLAVEGSPVLEDLAALVESGTAVWVCGTCLDYYELKDRLRVGEVSNMYSLAELLLQAGSVIRP